MSVVARPDNFRARTFSGRSADQTAVCGRCGLGRLRSAGHGRRGWKCLEYIAAAGSREGIHTRGAGQKERISFTPTADWLFKQVDAVPGRSRNPLLGLAALVWVAGPYTSVASLFAARFRVGNELTEIDVLVQPPGHNQSRRIREKQRSAFTGACAQPYLGGFLEYLGARAHRSNGLATAACLPSARRA